MGEQGGRQGHVAATVVALAVVLMATCCAETLSPAPSPTPVNTPTTDSRFTIARVVNVIDGATIDVESDGQVFRVRYLGIEIPNEVSSGENVSSLSQRALQFNRHLVEDETVELEKGTVDTDASGRLLRYVYVNGEMVNETLLINGYATVASFPPDFQHQTHFAVLEESARKNQRGLWTSSELPLDEEAPLTPVQPFEGGTLPLPPDMRSSATVCDYSNTDNPVIKGNVDRQTEERIYHVPGGFFYSTTAVSISDGDRWFCTEEEAVAAGWKKSKH